MFVITRGHIYIRQGMNVCDN